eukprot:7591666-Pyramimonas_sp.AAC.1
MGRAYGLPDDVIQKLPQMDQQLMAKLFPVLVRAVLGNSFQLRQLASATFNTILIDEAAPVVVAAFKGGRAYA